MAKTVRPAGDGFQHAVERQVAERIDANVARDFGDRGNLTLYARYLNDKNQFITPIPLIQEGRDSFREYPGFDNSIDRDVLSLYTQFACVPAPDRPAGTTRRSDPAKAVPAQLPI